MYRSLVLITLLLCIAFSSNCFAQEKANQPEKGTMKPALLVIDIQNAYLDYTDADERKIAMEMLNACIWLFHENRLPVICIYHSAPDWGPKPGTEPFEYPKSIMLDEKDIKVIKNFPSAFQKTDLDKILKEKDCNTLFLCGLSSVGCVLATYFGAMERDYKVFMVRDAIMSHNSNYTNVIKDICESVGFDTIRFMLEKMK